MRKTKPYSRELSNKYRPKAKRVSKQFLIEQGYLVNPGGRYQPDWKVLRSTLWNPEASRYVEATIKTSFSGELFLYSEINIPARVLKFKPLTVLVINTLGNRILEITSESFPLETVEKHNKYMPIEEFISVPLHKATCWKKDKRGSKWEKDAMAQKFFNRFVKETTV